MSAGQCAQARDVGDGFSTYYAETMINGVQCVEWKFPALPDDKAQAERERARRRRIKDYVGSEHLDTPMLDSKTSRNGSEYCDIIVVTEHLTTWEQTMSAHYTSKGYAEVKKKYHTNGFQTAWSDNGTPIVSINMYPNKGQFMVQPGDRNPDRLMDWIQHCDLFKLSLPSVTGQSEDHDDGLDAVPLIPTAPPQPLTPSRPSTTASVTLTAPEEENVRQDMMICFMCTKWFSNEIPGPPGLHSQGSWPCPVCRQVGAQVGTILETMTAFSAVIHKLNDKIDQNDRAHHLEMTLANKKLTNENDLLRKSVADLTQKVNKLSWKSFRDPQQKGHLLIGSSIIRDVDNEKLLDTEVICKRGGTIQTIKQEMDKLNNGYEQITVLVGGNDCDTKPHVQASDIVKSYCDLIDTATAKANLVTVSSICPRLTSDSTQETIDAVNAGLLAACSEKDSVTFIDNTPSFKLGDGTVNDGYLLADGVHITRPAMNKLAKNLKMKVRNQVEGVCKNIATKPNSTNFKTAPTHDTPISKPKNSNDTDHYGGQWMTQRNRSRQHHRDNQTHDSHSVRCDFCAEDGHNKNRCKHGQPIECHSCRRFGHKSKFCKLFTVA
jgi:hypothetical protein